MIVCANCIWNHYVYISSSDCSILQQTLCNFLIAASNEHVSNLWHLALDMTCCNLRCRREEAKRIQVQTFTRWCNARLATRQQKIDDLTTDLRDGTKLLALLEILSKKSPGKFHKKPKNQAQRAENVDAALQFITQKEKINIANIGTLFRTILPSLCPFAH